MVRVNLASSGTPFGRREGGQRPGQIGGESHR